MYNNTRRFILYNVHVPYTYKSDPKFQGKITTESKVKYIHIDFNAINVHTCTYNKDNHSVEGDFSSYFQF